MNILMPFGTPYDLEAGNLKEHMAGSHAEMIDFSVSIESYIDTRYPELQIQSNNKIHAPVFYMADQWRSDVL